MNRIYEALFDGYADPLLQEPLPLSDRQRLDLTDALHALRLRWSTDAFAVGLHLGLSLLRDDIRRPGAQQIQ
ncbi:hypothetical protein [uncultured Oscillibacter sp.]|uniref:hypothetical protein n=1 Tax=uncultured Oscillibacter sp. TaxID=876091 RepID=UPI0025D6D160|nr:hypothetical protein [uncultured Oscillibacter sp.]